ncbi:type IV pilin N-terminal domain-containing protein [uncultured Methanomethylovorans sp.]|uniref:type IV pilin N-terminal domain-containing protein n=1 Tax=uncultured Methanomethylovorans sp. TaxID=183759 RepID=UPI002AA660DE|nr:type IV pilin N-terminal domain-containing protein [uncultured Methanomethylovorans sp.]
MNQKRLFSSFLKIRFTDQGISPVIGTLLMLVLTMLLVGVAAVSLAGIPNPLKKGLTADVEIEFIEGGVPNEIRYRENFITLAHKGGDPLPLEDIQIVIDGKGSSYTGVVAHGGRIVNGDVQVTYLDLCPAGKGPHYETRNSCIADGYWSAGEAIVLNGDDGLGNNSTVKVQVGSTTNTSNNFGFKKGTKVNIKILETPSSRLISSCNTNVMAAKKI